MVYFRQSLITKLFPFWFMTTFCFSFQPSLRTRSMGRVTEKDQRPTLVILRILLSLSFRMDLRRYLRKSIVLHPGRKFNESLLATFHLESQLVGRRGGRGAGSFVCGRDASYGDEESAKSFGRGVTREVEGFFVGVGLECHIGN